jgi:non-lysosomal glucosylceramidase
MPFTASMERRSKPRSGITLGGIGTGGIELRQDGVFYNWHIFNNIPFGTGERLLWPEAAMLFFVLRYQEQGKAPRMKLLQIDDLYEAAAIPLHHYIFPWLSGVDRVEYSACFPYAWLRFIDKQMPFEVEMEAFSPFIPHDVKNSSLPAIIFNFKITSLSDRPVDVMLMASLRSGVGYDNRQKMHTSRVLSSDGVAGFEYSCMGMDTEAASYGSQALVSLSGDSSYFLGWEHLHPHYEIALRNNRLPNIDATAERCKTDAQTGEKSGLERLFGTAAVSASLEPGGVLRNTFLTGWHFPNLYSDDHGESAPRKKVGNYYNRYFENAGAVLEYVRQNLQDLSQRTLTFKQDFYDSSLPDYVLDQINSQLNTFVSSAWLTQDGSFAIHEGMTADQSWGPMATVDVAYYGAIMTLALFPELDQSMLRAHARLQTEFGQVNHGIERNFDYVDPMDRRESRVDMPGEFIGQVIRHAFWTGDDAFLKDMWPHVLKAADFIINERDANVDMLPDMSGANSSFDNLPMFGAAAFTSSIWLSALDHIVAAAKVLGDAASMQKWAEIRAAAGQQFESKLWNGRYYRLYHDCGGPSDTLDDGCFTDQVIGQWSSRLVGLRDVLPRERIHAALNAIFDLSFDKEYGLRNCSWPGDGFWHEIPDSMWVDQVNTCWTGVELEFAALLMYEGFFDQALQIIRCVNERYTDAGIYFDHQEFGGHYYRPMSAWSIINASLGLSIQRNCYRFSPWKNDQPLKLFFAHPGGTGQYDWDPRSGSLTIRSLSGTWQVREIRLPDLWDDIPQLDLPSEAYNARVDGNELVVLFPSIRPVTSLTMRPAERGNRGG